MKQFRCRLKQRSLVSMLLLFVSLVSFAQSRTISGTVRDQEGNLPLPGVSVVVKGSTSGTQTNAEGNYTLNVPANATALVFSFTGYTTQEVRIGTEAIVNVTLSVNNSSLDAVVVVGYGTLKKKEITSAISSVTPDDFRQSGARNALDLAQGKVAGLTITRTSGSNPNSGVNIQIRGINSLTAGNSPLIVIDGIPGGNLDLLQQDDIESIDVLKDGSAAAIYGTRGNGGVILITTKKGKAGEARYDYNGYLRHETPIRMPEFYSAAEIRQLIAEGKLSQNRDNPAWGGVSTNMFDDVVHNTSNISQYHNLAISGGTRNMTYRASLYYQNLQGIANQNERTNYGARVNLNHKGFKDRLTTLVNAATNYNKANLIGIGWETILSRLPTQPIYNPDGTFYEDPTTTGSNNQASIYDQEKSTRDQQTTSFDVKFTLELLKGLKVSAFGALQRDMYVDNQYKDIGSRNSLVGSTNSVTPNGTGYAYKGQTNNNNYAFEPTIDYSTTFGEHTLNALAGYSYRYEVNESFSVANSGYVNDLFENNNMGAGRWTVAQSANMSSNKNDNTLIAFFGRVNYSFMDRYFVQAILRREGSSRFGANNKWANFPAVSAGWDISKENFMESLAGTFNTLKLRVGYGQTGNTGFSNYASLVTLGTGGFYLYPDGVWRQTYGPNRNPNPDLKWETKKELNIGLDFGILKNRISGAIEVFRRRTEDLLETFDTQLPAFVQTSIYTNVGTIENKGIELTLSAQIFKQKDLSWNMDFTGSTQTNKLITFSNAQYRGTAKSYGDIGGAGALGSAIRTVEGGQLGAFWGKRFAGFSPTDGSWLFYTRDNKAVPFSQINTSTDPNTTDLAVLGYGIPKYYASWTNSVSYKGFDFRIFFRGKFGHKILNRMDMTYANKQTATNLLKSTFGRHNQLNTSAVANTYQYSDYYLEPGSYIKLDEITLAYNFKLKTDWIRSLRVYAAAQNLATITRYKGNDPDFISDTGLDAGLDSRGPYPSTTSFLFGVNLGF
jgi:TonB-linked SusC/RagA family outer membrane protein